MAWWECDWEGIRGDWFGRDVDREASGGEMGGGEWRVESVLIRGRRGGRVAWWWDDDDGGSDQTGVAGRSATILADAGFAIGGLLLCLVLFAPSPDRNAGTAILSFISLSLSPHYYYSSQQALLIPLQTPPRAPSPSPILILSNSNSSHLPRSLYEYVLNYVHLCISHIEASRIPPSSTSSQASYHYGNNTHLLSNYHSHPQYSFIILYYNHSHNY